MKTTFSLLRILLACLCINTLCAYAATTPYKGVLWKASKSNQNTVDQEIYLWGVTHGIPHDSNYQLTKTVRNIAARNNLYIAEADISREKDTKNTVSKNLLLPEGTTLRDVLTEDAYIAFQENFRRLGLPDVMMTEFEKFRPEMFSGMAYFELFEEKNKTKYKSGYDEILKQQQIANKKNIFYFENLKETLDIFEAACPGKTDVSTLLIEKFNLQNYKLGLTYSQTLDHLMAEGNLRELNTLIAKMHTELRSEEIEYRCSVVPRNKMWAQKIKALKTTDMPVLVTVGAFHLLGEGSLIELLKKDGYKVEFIEQEE
jgi:uncharacterized protein